MRFQHVMNSLTMMFNIAQTIERVRELTILANALRITSLDRLLNDDKSEFTVFAPNNLAFAKISGINLKLLTRDKHLLTEILSVHIVEGNLERRHLLDLCQDGTKQTTLASIDRSLLTIDLSNGINISNAQVLTTDTSASNGTIHIIDRVLYIDS